MQVFQSKVKKLPKFKLLKHELRDIIVTVVKAEEKWASKSCVSRTFDIFVSSWKFMKDLTFLEDNYVLRKKINKKVHLLQNSQKNVCGIIWLLFCYNMAIIQIIIKLQQKLYVCKKTFRTIIIQIKVVKLDRCVSIYVRKWCLLLVLNLTKKQLQKIRI